MKIISENSTIETSALHLLHRAGQCADDLFASNIGGSDLTPRQFEVLKAVSNHNSPSQTALVALTGIDRSTLADIVRRLVERGLIQRQRTAHDARKYAVKLTLDGQTTLDNATPAVTSTNERLLASLPDECKRAFLASLEQIIEAIKLEQSAANRKNAA